MKNGLNKTKKGKFLKFEFKSNKLKFANIGLKSKEAAILNSKQIESAKKAIIKITKSKCKIWVRASTLIAIFNKPIGVRMGKGKGKFSHFICKINSGSIIFELCGSNKKTIIKSLLACKFKLPIKTKLCFKIIT